MGTPPIIREFIDEGGFLVYYGEPSVGKTALAKLLLETISKYDYRTCYIATESGSIASEDRVFAISLYHLAEEVFKCVARGITPVIDTINSFYTGSAEDARILAFVSALLRAASVPAVAAGQVRASGVLWGRRWILPWATHVGVVRRLRRGVSLVEFKKPYNAVTAFRVYTDVRGVVEWI